MTIAARAGRGASMVPGVGLLLTFFVLISLTCSLEKSPTIDESFHLMAGYSHLIWGDFRINPEPPPLAKALAALPLLFSKYQRFRRLDDDSLRRILTGNGFAFSDHSRRAFPGRRGCLK